MKEENSDNYKSHDDDAEEKIPLMIRVTAPATLPGGYTFEALINDDPERPFTCEVPEEGVVEGQVFMAALPDYITSPRIQAPTGKWKDGLFQCFKHGVFHPHIWCAFCCSKISMAQIMTRMKLTWLGEHGPRESTRNTFLVVLILLISYSVYSTSLGVGTWHYPPGNAPIFFVVAKYIGATIFIFWSIYSLMRTRQSIREQYSIPERTCIGCEDCCCAFFCTCCALSQMARHTGEYETYQGAWCTKTGLPDDAPGTV